MSNTQRPSVPSSQTIQFNDLFEVQTIALILGIALLLVGLQSLKAALANPVNSIKSE